MVTVKGNAAVVFDTVPKLVPASPSETTSTAPCADSCSVIVVALTYGAIGVMTSVSSNASGVTLATLGIVFGVTVMVFVPASPVSPGTVPSEMSIVKGELPPCVSASVKATGLGDVFVIVTVSALPWDPQGTRPNCSGLGPAVICAGVPVPLIATPVADAQSTLVVSNADVTDAAPGPEGSNVTPASPSDAPAASVTCVGAPGY